MLIFSLPKAIYNLDLVALMAGGRFQEIANQFVEQMERHAEKEQANSASTTPTAAAQSHRLTAASVGESSGKGNVGDKAATAVAPLKQGAEHVGGSAAKKAKQEDPRRSDEEGRGFGRGGGVRRVRCPSLDVFQREYMETATPVILTGVSSHAL